MGNVKGSKHYDLSQYDPDNPKIGDLRRKHHKGGDSDIQVYSACIDCGKTRWVNLCDAKKQSGRCIKCGIIHQHSIPPCDMNNPKLGDMRKKLRPDGIGSNIYIWSACPICGKEDWHRKQKNNVIPRCKSCASSFKGRHNCGTANACWKGGRFKRDGYIFILCPDHPHAVGGYVPEHRLVMEKALGRYLSRSEVVHHKNGIRDDNRLENLVLLSRPVHTQTMLDCKECGLRKEIRMLRWQIKELREALQLKLGETIIEKGG